MGKGPFLTLRETIERVHPLVEHILFIWKKRLSNELLGGPEEVRIKRREEMGRMIALKMGLNHKKRVRGNGAQNCSVTVTEVDDDEFLL